MALLYKSCMHVREQEVWTRIVVLDMHGPTGHSLCSMLLVAATTDMKKRDLPHQVCGSLKFAAQYLVARTGSGVLINVYDYKNLTVCASCTGMFGGFSTCFL